MKNKPFALIGVNVVKHDPKALKKVMIKEKLNWRSIANNGESVRKWNSPATPAFYVIDAKGAIRRKWIGHPGGKAIDSALKSLIQAAEKPAKNGPNDRAPLETEAEGERCRATSPSFLEFRWFISS